METKELDNQNRVELLENLKDKCKSIVKRDLYIGLIVWFFVILLMIFYWPKPDSPKNVFYSIFFIVMAVLGGWLLLFDILFLKKADNLDTPDLLNLFEKKHRYNIIGWLVSLIFVMGGFIFASDFNIGAFVGVGIGIVIIVLLFFNDGGPWWYRKEKDIIEQLQELAEKK